MPKKIKIAITQRIDFIESYNEYRSSLDIRLINLISIIEFIPIIIPNGLSSTDLITWLNQVKPHGILLSGGNNIGEYAIRDDLESGVYKWALEKGKPILGICRGMQFINYINGGKLKQVENHVSKKHEIYEEEGLPSSLPGEVVSPTQPVSSVAFTRQKFELTTRN